MASGNELALETARVILLRDDLHQLLDTIKCGRLAFRNFRKLVVYLMPGSIYIQVCSMILSLFAGITCNLSSFSMFCTSFWVDMAPSFAMVNEKEEEDLMLSGPRAAETRLVDWRLLVQGNLITGTCLAIVTQSVFYLYMSAYAHIGFADMLFQFGSPSVNVTTNVLSNDEHVNVGTSVAFVASVFVSMLGTLMANKTARRSFFQQSPLQARTRNLWVYAAACVSILICIVAVNVTFFQDQFNTRSVPAVFYVIAVVAGLAVLTVDELRKLLVRHKIAYFHRFAW